MMEKLILKDSTWLRGRYSHHNPAEDEDDMELSSCLFRGSDGRMCCLGADAVRSGFTRRKIQGMPTPAAFLRLFEPGQLQGDQAAYADRWTKESEYGIVRDYNSAGAGTLMDINDDIKITDEERVERMRPIFAEYGIELVFLPNE
jgi:hypothetical protein